MYSQQGYGSPQPPQQPQWVSVDAHNNILKNFVGILAGFAIYDTQINNALSTPFIIY
jgi:hypothetical protein